jgi:hypothetical protein
MALLRRLLRHTLLGFAALILLFEEWGWEQLSALVARLSALPFFAWLEQRIRLLPPWAALATYILPALALVPLKLLALFFMGQGHALLGVGVLVGAKFIGTAVLARLFTLTQPTLMRLPWFARWYPRWKAWKDGVMDQVRGSPAWQAIKRGRAAVGVQWADFRRRHGPGGRP